MNLILRVHYEQSSVQQQQISKQLSLENRSQEMQNYPYPFNQKEHIFDFKVKVNFENGNVSLTAPQIVTPPTRFGNLPSNCQPSANIYTSPAKSHHEGNTGQQYRTVNNYPNSLQRIQPVSHLQTQINRNNLLISKAQNIELINSSYASIHQNADDFSLINNSMQAIQCVLCQKSFSAVQFDQHLQLHRKRNNRTCLSTNQKNNASNYAMTQHSFNGNNDSIMSAANNESYHSNRSNSLHNSSGFVPHFQPFQQQQNNFYNCQVQLPPLKQSSHLLGRIDNPLLAINAAQQNNLSLSSSSQHQNNSLNYSNSHNQSTTRYNDPNPHQSIEQSPNFNQADNSNGSSFGHHGGNHLIGPSFYQNSSQQSGTNSKNKAFVKGVNRLAYNDANNLVGSHQSQRHGQVNNLKGPNLLYPDQNQSYHSNYSHPSQYSSGSHYSQQYIHPQVQNRSQQHNFCYQQNASNKFKSNHNSMQSQHSYQSAHSLQNNCIAPQNHMMMQNFQTIESRYLNQPATNSRQLYSSQKQLSSGFLNQAQIRNSRNGSRQYEDGIFNENDISSINGQSRNDMSEYSDWNDLNNQRQEQKLQGYNSADNSLIKHMQQKKQQSLKSNNIYLDKLDSNQKTQQDFFKKKKDHMINSATSYYDRKFKDQAQSSSSDEEFAKNTGRLSYAERLKEKKVTDNSRPVDLANSKSGRLSNNLKNSSKSRNLSNCSEDSGLSKTKLPLNYLAREEFISTSSTSKSTHKTNVPG